MLTVRASIDTLGFRWLIHFTMATAASRGLAGVSGVRASPLSRTYALPFFELMRSAISRSSARLGSKFCGSTAFSSAASQPCLVPTNQWRLTNVSLQGRLRRLAVLRAKPIARSVARRSSLHGWRKRRCSACSRPFHGSLEL